MQTEDYNRRQLCSNFQLFWQAAKAKADWSRISRDVFTPWIKKSSIGKRVPSLGIRKDFMDWEIESQGLWVKWFISNIIRIKIDKLSASDLGLSNLYLLKYQRLLIIFTKYFSNLLFFNLYVIVLIQTTIISHMEKSKSSLSGRPTSISAFLQFILQMFTSEGYFTIHWCNQSLLQASIHWLSVTF